MKLTLTIALSVLLLVPHSSVTAANDEDADRLAELAAERKAERERVRYIIRNRPARVDGPLRIENISDIEVREIESVMREKFPGAILNIGGVTVGCPCEDGAGCDAQVWVVAHRANRSNGLMLSKIENSWQVGPLQEWWLRYDKLNASMRAAYKKNSLNGGDAWLQYQEKLNHHRLEFPSCGLELREVSAKQ